MIKGPQGTRTKGYLKENNPRIQQYIEKQYLTIEEIKAFEEELTQKLLDKIV